MVIVHRIKSPTKNTGFPLLHSTRLYPLIATWNHEFPPKFTKFDRHFCLRMENMMGLLRIHVKRGINLAIRDLRSSDPYVIIRMGKQKLKTKVVKKNLNPEWNEDLTLSVTDPSVPIKLAVYDRDRFSRDDNMGDAEIDIRPLFEAVTMRFEDLPNGIILKKVQPNRQNCLAEESSIVWYNGKVVQHMFLRLRNVECGEIELQLQWINVHVPKASERVR